MEKITNRKALVYAMEHLPDAPKEIVDKFKSMIDALDKKNASPKKVTEKQVKNEAIKDAINAFLVENEDKGFTCSEIMKRIPIIHENKDETPQHISALLRLLILDNKVEKYTDKRKSYFKAKVEE